MIDSLKQRAHQLLWPFNFTVPARINGERFRLPILRGMGGGLRHDAEPWMTGTLRHLLALAPGAAFMDVGVNLGQTLLKVKSLARDITYLGFEPSAFCVHFVNELIRLNQLPNCELIPAGLADQAGLLEFVACSEVDAGASTVADLRPGRVPLRRQHVPVFALDDLSPDLVSANYAFIKIDDEGAEFAVLSGMQRFLKQRQPWVICEVWHADTAAQLPTLRERNAQLTRLLDDCEYFPYRLLKTERQTLALGLQPVTLFDDLVWNGHTSPATCDYLFGPTGAVAQTLRAFGAAS